MMDWIKSRGIATWLILAGIMLSFIGVIIYMVTSMSGYLAGTSVDALPIVFTFISIIALAVVMVFSDKLDGKVIDILVIGSAILLIFSFALFIVARVNIIGEVNYMIINVTDAQVAALNTSIVGFVFYGLSVVTLAAGTFFPKLTKKEV